MTDPGPRCSGRTTMQALNAVHVILDNPGKWVVLDDHFQENHLGDRRLFGLVCAVLNALNVPLNTNAQRMEIMCEGPSLHPYVYPRAEEVLALDLARKYDSHGKRDTPNRIHL